jgi:hypothetical protein
MLVRKLFFFLKKKKLIMLGVTFIENVKGKQMLFSVLLNFKFVSLIRKTQTKDEG